jgi:hypothetical protein
MHTVSCLFILRLEWVGKIFPKHVNVEISNLLKQHFDGGGADEKAQLLV